MNKEILFRGKTLYDHYDHYASPEPDIKGGTWVYGGLMTEYPYHKGLTIVENGVCHEVDPETVGQYTGLKDKNGVKIFEGDALKVINPNDEEDNLCVVKWDNLCGGYPYEPWGGFGDFDVSTVGWAMTMEFTFEVIGNIHDNPELLEVLGDD